MPTPLIVKPGVSLGSALGVVSGSHLAVGCWDDSCWIPPTPLSENFDRWGRAVQQAAYCLAVGSATVLPVKPFEFVDLTELPSPVVTTQSVNCVHSCDQGKLAYEHRKYIKGLTVAGTISLQTERRALDIWGNLWRNCPDLAVPDAAAGLDGEIQYTWSRGDHYLSLDIIPEQPSEFFYRNRQTGMIWECEPDQTVSEVSVELANYLKLFLISKTA